eukprot:215419-Chlamydomonas_euryale.AAC.8
MHVKTPRRTRCGSAKEGHAGMQAACAPPSRPHATAHSSPSASRVAASVSPASPGGCTCVIAGQRQRGDVQIAWDVGLHWG